MIHDRTTAANNKGPKAMAVSELLLLSPDGLDSAISSYCKEKVAPMLFLGHSSLGFEAFQSVTSATPGTSHSLPHSPAELCPSPDINLWNHKVITKLFPIFLLKTPYWRMSVNWNQAYIFPTTTEPEHQNFLWTPAELNLYFIDLVPSLRHSS